MRPLLLLVVAAFAVSPVHAQCPDGTPPPCPPRPLAGRLGPTERVPSLSVLYFESLSADTTDAALADGITEELIAHLSQVEGLRVASRHSALRYRGRRGLDPRLVGRELGVRYVLQGTLRRAEARVRVAVEVTEVATGYNVWGQTYDQPRRDVFAVQDSVALHVVEAIRGRLTGQDRARLVTPPGTNPEAMEAYLRGRAAVRVRSPAAGAQAIAHYRRAIVLDPRFAPAYAALAHAYVLGLNWAWGLPDAPPDSLPAFARRAAARALALDSTSADAWLAQAMAIRDDDPPRALAFLRRAVARDSTNVEALHQWAFSLYTVGEVDSAIATEERVTIHDPYYAYAYAGLAQLLVVARRPIDALARAAQGLAIDSTHAPLYWHTAEANLMLGRSREARAAASRAIGLGLSTPPMLALLAIADFVAGDTAGARVKVAEAAAQLRRELDRSPSGLPHFQAGLLSGAYAQLGEADSAVAWAQRIMPGQRRYYSTHLARHWFWDPVRSDPRFQRLIEESRPLPPIR